MSTARLTARATLAAAVLVAMPAVASASEWEIDSSHSSAQFSVRHMMVSNVRGEIAGVTGTVRLDDRDVTKSTVEAKLDVTTINTREPKRDAHLKSADFFDTAKYPTITFKSKKVRKEQDGTLSVVGDLTMHGVTKEVTLAVTLPATELKDPYGNVRRGGSATTKISRKEFGLKWNPLLETGGAVVGDEAKIDIDFELTKKAPKKDVAQK